MNKETIFRVVSLFVWILSFIFFIYSVFRGSLIGIFLLVFVSGLILIFELYFRVQHNVDRKFFELKEYFTGELNKLVYESEFKFDYLSGMLAKKKSKK